MSATFHLHCGPARAALAEPLLRQALEKTRLDPGSVLWLAPSRHAVHAIRARLRLAPSVAGMRLAAIDDLIAAVLVEQGLELLSPGQRRLVVEEVLADLVAAGRLRHFGAVGDTAGFAERVLAWIDDLRGARVRSEEFERAAIGPKQQEGALLYRRYDEALRRISRHDAAGREYLAAEALAECVPPLLEGVSAVYLTGANVFTSGLKALLQALAERVEVVHVALFDEPGDGRSELLTHPREACRWLEERGATSTAIAASEVDRSPAGLDHLADQLFRSLRNVRPAADATGLRLLRAPGLAGEVRLVARAVKRLLLAGEPVDGIDIVVRDINTYADLLSDRFTDYGIPIGMEPRVSLLRQPAVALLLRALRLADEEFPFAGVTALLRHGGFRPAWGETDLAQKAEALLRLLAVPRGREAYLAAVERWAERVQPGLEDEAAEESRRQRTHKLAQTCQAFLTRFFRAWDGAPGRASVAEHLVWVRWLLDELGLVRDDGDDVAWDCFWREAHAWQARASGVLDRKTFQRRLAALLSRTQAPSPPPPETHVAVLTAEQARHRPVDYRFILGLGERGFPRPADESSLLADGGPRGDHLASEMLLFYEVVTGARRGLTLSYPAVDDRGQEMLPGSFLQAVEACFEPGAVPCESRRMLIEGYLDDEPLSPVEYRTRVGAAWPLGAERLEENTRANLFDAAQLAQARFRERGFTPYDGLFRDPFLIDWVGRLFGPQRIFSPTALEDYIACPFRFYLRHVLHLEPLEDPREEIEVTRRGMVVHRALARLHDRLRAAGRHLPDQGVEEAVLHEMAAAVEEDVSRAPGAAAKELWRLEGQRLLKAARRYPSHWSKFLKPWLERGVAPRPHLFEVDFGMPVPAGATPIGPLILRDQGVEVRVWGRIDRVDVAELEDGVGFWIIDYKTGRSTHYTAADLAEFRKVQLTLYAAAVEAVFLHDRKARPLGLAYWLVGEAGAKVVLPGRNATAWLEETARWPAIREQLTRWVASLATGIRGGAFPLAPRSEHCTQTCPYSQACRISQARPVGKAWELPLPGTEGQR